MTEVPLEVTPNALGSWCTMMMTPMPARNPVTMGSDRKSAIQPRRRSPTPNTTSPVTTAVTATSSKYRVVERGASRRRTTAKSGAMVESAPTDMTGFEPTTTKTIVAVMNAIIATYAGTPASRDVASCSGTAIASKVTPARNCPETFARVTPLNVSRSPLPASRRPIGIRSLVLVDCEGAITSTYDGVARRLVGRDDLESLGELALLHAGTLRSHSRPRPQHLLQTLAVTNLTDVLAQCGVLLVEGLRDVDDHGRIDAAQPDLVDGVGLEPFANQFGKGVRVSRVGIHRAQRRLTGRHVVGVTREDAFVVALGTLGDDEVRSTRSSGQCRNVRFVTPTSFAASVCSASRMAMRSSRVSEESSPPASPDVTRQYATSTPRFVKYATVPAVPKSTSSGCATTTSARLIDLSYE